jgi:predicted nuclease with TOPRIM domain
MADEQIDYSQLFNFLYRIDKRINYLEKDLIYLEKSINNLENKRSVEFSKLNEDMKILHQTISSLKKQFGQCSHYMSILGKELKNCIKIDDVNSLNSAVDDIKFEEYITRKEILNKRII